MVVVHASSSVVVLGVKQSIGCNHVLDFDLYVFKLPSLDACLTQITDHALDSSVDVVLVLATCANGTPGAEHENRKFRVNHSVDDTRELFWLVFAVQLDGNVW